MRKFVYVDGSAQAWMYQMEMCRIGPLVNVGISEYVSIPKPVASLMKVVGFSGNGLFDWIYIDGMPKKINTS